MLAELCVRVGSGAPERADWSHVLDGTGEKCHTLVTRLRPLALNPNQSGCVVMRIARSLLLSSSLIVAACSSASSPGSNGNPVGGDDTGVPVDSTPKCNAGSACTIDGGGQGICQSDGTCGCADTTDNDACNALYGDGTKSFQCLGGQCTLAYPAGNLPGGKYGLGVGAVFPNIQFMGYKNGDNSDPANWVPMSMLDYYDPDGSRGVTGIYLVVGAQWCPPCNDEADHLPAWWPTDYQPRGAKFVTIVYQNSGYKQATRQTVDQWIKKHKINFDAGIDDSNGAIPKGSFGLPHNYIIDPRTMKVFRTVDGIDPAITTNCPKVACCDPAVDPTTCSQKYVCSSTLSTCLPPGTSGPVPQLEYVMKQNGAAPFTL